MKQFLLILLLLVSNKSFAQRLYKSAFFKYSIKIPKGYSVETKENHTPSGLMCLRAIDSTSVNGFCFGCETSNTIVINHSLISDWKAHSVNMTLDKLASLPDSWAFTETVGGATRVHPNEIHKKFTTLNGQRAYYIDYDEGSPDTYSSVSVVYFVIKGNFLYSIRYTSTNVFKRAANGDIDTVKRKTPAKPEEGMAAIKTFKLL